MSENSGKIERIENAKLVELLGTIRQDSSEENMIAVLKEAAVAKFLVPVDGTEGDYRFHAVSDSKGLKYMVVYCDSDSFEVAFEDKKEPQNGVIAGFADLIDVVMAPKMDLQSWFGGGIIRQRNAEDDCCPDGYRRRRDREGRRA